MKSQFRRVVCTALMASVAVMPSVALAQVQTYACSGGFGPVPAVVPPAVLMQSLGGVPNPVIPADPVTGAPTVRDNLKEFVANLPAAIQLGKALFWDMQAGSDGKTACGSCHFQAGADNRIKQQLNPGPNSSGFVANKTLSATDFPFASSNDDIAGSQGVRVATYGGVSKTGVETMTTTAGSMRQVTGKNSPSVINSVFNHRQFWDGRAQADFNGVNPFGNRDANARVWVVAAGGNSVVQTVVNIPDASLASQAVGPVLSTVEMSAAGRTFPELGKKMLLVKPLGQQRVSLTDSVLGPLADVSTGLKTSYGALIQQAFQPKWWNAKKTVTVNGVSYTMMQANFSLFWGLSIMLYEATLVADRSPMDQYLASRVFDATTGTLLSHNPSLLNATASRLGTTVSRLLNGLALFELPVAPPPSFPVPPGFGVGCIGCHVGAETTSASMRNLAGPGVEPEHGIFRGGGFDVRMERMFTKLDWNPPGAISPTPRGADVVTFDPSNYAVNVTSINGTAVSPVRLPVNTYDVGWYNLGVRPTAEDAGIGAKDPFGKPLSWIELFQTLSDPSFIKVPGGTLECATAGNTLFPAQVVNPSGFPLLSGPLNKTEATGVAGAFKTPSLRNLEFTGPYFHNGGKSTLRQVIDFYNRGGDFSGNPTRHPTVLPLALTVAQQEDLVAFLMSLNDERVAWQRAPFDRPQIILPQGQDAAGNDLTVTLPEVGANGWNTPLTSFLGLNPFQP